MPRHYIYDVKKMKCAAIDGLEVRPATAADVSSALQFFKHDRNLDHPERSFEYGEEDLRAYIEAPHCLFLVAISGGEVVGLVIAYDLVTWGYCDEICVAHQSRGGGIGEALLQAVDRIGAGRWACLEVCYDRADPKTGQYLRGQGFDGDEHLVWMTRPVSHLP